MGFRDNYKPTVSGGGGYFKPAEHASTHAILIEFKGQNPVAPHPFKDKPNTPPTRHEVYADLTFFATPEHLDAGKPSSFITNATIVNQQLVADLSVMEPGACDVKGLIRGTKGNNPWLWQSKEGEIVDKVEAYYDAREAEKAAAAKELDDLNLD